MNAREESIRRLSMKRQRKLGPLSDEAYQELELAVRANPQQFVDDDEEQAFAIVGQALARILEAHRNDEFLDDEHYASERRRRLQQLSASCEQALALDDSCLDARHLHILCQGLGTDNQLKELLTLEEDIAASQGPLNVPAAGDAWADVFLRPRLRLVDSIARTCLNTARFRMTVDRCTELLTKAPLDVLGARFTCALAMARLEDEEGFEWLDVREGRRGNAWFHLSRALLMYKLGRMPAARRALLGFDRLCTGGAYVLLQPIFVDTYLPDRPAFEPGSFEEAMIAVHEADPVISDVPDFAIWACDQPGFLASAKKYCQQNGFEWRDWE